MKKIYIKSNRGITRKAWEGNGTGKMKRDRIVMEQILKRIYATNRGKFVNFHLL